MKIGKWIGAILIAGVIAVSISAMAAEGDASATHGKTPETEHAVSEAGHENGHADSERHEEGSGAHGDAHDDAHGGGHGNLGEDLPLWSCVPFACMLLSIA